ncbi:MAG TPA: response regulator transcription factor [Xanthobacteraceae bacterium]|nr:response regulator transcription factor [Xanthobacteraceae bacterium]
MIHARKPLADDAPHLLVVDDDLRIRDLLSRYLLDHGFRVTTASSAAEARARLDGMTFDALVLDVMMPGESGLDLARSIRNGSTVPILMLTARTETEDRIAGLETGVDDYVAKPFDPRELLLRIHSVLRRTTTPTQPAIETVRFGDFVFHIESGELTRDGKPVKITDRERDMLRVLAAKPGETVPRQALVAPGADANERAVDVQINRLRRKIEKNPTNPAYLRTVRGGGYRLVVIA